MSTQSKVVRYGTLAGRAITTLTLLSMSILWLRFLLTQGPETLAPALMVTALAAVCLIGTWFSGKYRS